MASDRLAPRHNSLSTVSRTEPNCECIINAIAFHARWAPKIAQNSSDAMCRRRQRCFWFYFFFQNNFVFILTNFWVWSEQNEKLKSICVSDARHMCSNRFTFWAHDESMSSLMIWCLRYKHFFLLLSVFRDSMLSSPRARVNKSPTETFVCWILIRSKIQFCTQRNEKIVNSMRVRRPRKSYRNWINFKRHKHHSMLCFIVALRVFSFFSNRNYDANGLFTFRIFHFISTTEFHCEAARSESRSEWHCIVWVSGFGQSAAIGVLDERRLSNAHVSRQFVRTHSRDQSRNAANPGRSERRRWIFRVLGSECGRLGDDTCISSSDIGRRYSAANHTNWTGQSNAAHGKCGDAAVSRNRHSTATHSMV